LVAFSLTIIASGTADKTSMANLPVGQEEGKTKILAKAFHDDV
jgi:hypothetical protein